MIKVTKKSLKRKENIQKKKKVLYDKYVTEQKGKTRKQISKHWEKYRGKKYSVEFLGKYRSKLSKAKDEIEESILREKYFEKKELKTLRVEYNYLVPTKKKKQKFSQQDYYKIRKDADIDNTIGKVFADEKKKVRYVLLTLKIKLSETGQIIFVSNTYTPTSFQSVIDDDEYGDDTGDLVLQNTLEKLSFVAKYKGFKLISTHLRLVYDKK